MHHRAPSPEAGFSLVELLVAIFVLLVGVLGTVALVDGANRTTSENRSREAATNITREMIEDARSIPYGSLDAASIASRLATMSNGTVQADGTVAYVRRGVTYTATPSLCYFDDPKDGYGSHAGASYCNSETGTTDTFPLDYKRFTIVTTWSGPRGSGTSRQSAVINDPGSSFAPQITAFAMTAPTSCTGNPACSQIDIAATSSATFSVSTSAPAAKVTWYVDDTKMGTASGSATGPWTFTWPLATVATGSHTDQRPRELRQGRRGAQHRRPGPRVADLRADQPLRRHERSSGRTPSSSAGPRSPRACSATRSTGSWAGHGRR